MTRHVISNVIGFDDFPFPRTHRGDVRVVGVVYSGARLNGVLSGRVRRDGANAAQKLAELVAGSKFAPQLQLVMLQGIALGGFNVVDIHGLHAELGIPVLVVARRAPRMGLIRDALLGRVPGGRRKWALVERAGAMESAGGVFVQRAGLSFDTAGDIIRRFSVYGNLPEPLRVAHLIAGGVGAGESRGRA
ncbi:MAG: uncharacterized protein QOG71_3349 [Pyrinomonadaceae bacterium]|nr:uncharacterized protein [Pyrinomonadaceae bacterium]